MAARLRHYGMGLLLDTVPNHMAASYENPWWTDVLENGQSSAYADYFDIDWHPATKKAAFLQENRVVLPILGDLYGNVLSSGQLSLRYRRHRHAGALLTRPACRLTRRATPRCWPAWRDTRNSTRSSAIWSACRRATNRSTEAVMLRRREKERIKQGSGAWCRPIPELKQEIENALAAVAASPDDLDALLSMQAYRLTYWKIGFEEINYRRFFDINELVGLRVEVPEVFDNRHRRTHRAGARPER